MGKSDNIVIILVLGAAAYLYFTLKNPVEKAIKAVESPVKTIVEETEKKYVADKCAWYQRIYDPIGCAVKDTVGGATKEVQAKPEAAFDPAFYAKQAVIAKKAIDAYIASQETPAKQEVAAQPTENPWHNVDYSPFSTKCPAGKTGWEGVDIGGRRWCT